MKMLRTPILVFMALLITSSLAFAQDNPCNPCGMKGKTFHLDDPMGRNTVTFKSEAPLEDIIGSTNKVSGYLSFDPKNPTGGGHGKIIVSAATFNTGIPLRNEHLRTEPWLNAEKYPEITLAITKIHHVKEVKSGKGSATYEVSVDADLTFKGKTKAISFPARITYLQESEMTKTKMDGDLLAVRGEFEVALADFGITGPPGMNLVGSKVGETITIGISVIGSTVAPAMAKGNPCDPCNPCNPCNPCGGK